MSNLEIETFERVLNAKIPYCATESEDTSRLHQACYIGELEDGSVVIPQEVGSQYKKMKTEEFERKREIRSYLTDCFRAAKILYGIVPTDIMVKLFNTNGKIAMTKEALCHEAAQIPEEFNEFIEYKDKFYFVGLFPEDRGLQQAQGGKNYYIPTCDEILDLGAFGYLPEKIELKNFVRYLVDFMKIPPEKANYAGNRVQELICGDFSMPEIFDMLEELDICIKNERQMQKMAELFGTLWNNTRMLLNRGYTPNELKLSVGTRPGIGASDSKIINFDKSRKKKVYPNDPCPCGSGKKYKNCCYKSSIDR